MSTVVAYILTIAAVIFTATAAIQAVFGGLIGRFVGPLIGALFGGLVAWVGVDLLWQWLEGGHVPIAVLASALIILFTHSAISRRELTEQATWAMAGEAWAIVLLGVFLVAFPGTTRWY